MVWALDCQDVAGADKLVLIGIANHADTQGRNAWPSVDTLSRYASVTRRSVQRSISNLTERGLLLVYPNEGGTRRTAADKRPNLYELIGMQTGATSASPGSTPRGDADVRAGRRARPSGVTCTSPEPSITNSEQSSNEGDAASDAAVLTNGQIGKAMQLAYWAWVEQRDGHPPISVNPVGFTRAMIKFLDAGMTRESITAAVKAVHERGAPMIEKAIEAQIDGRERRSNGRRPDAAAAVAGLVFTESGDVVG